MIIFTMSLFNLIIINLQQCDIKKKKLYNNVINIQRDIVTLAFFYFILNVL